MAKKYNPTPTTRLSGLSTWLNENKTGTIFENATINTESDNSTSTLVISLNQTSITLNIGRFGAAGGNVVVLSGGDSDKIWSLPIDDVINFSQCLLSTNGLIIELSPKEGLNYIAISVDSNNKLSVIWGTNSINIVDIKYYVGVSTSSINLNHTTITPQYNADLTSLALITPTTGSANIYFPNTYVAVATQLPRTGMYIVTINDNVYITNGIWYIPD